LEDRKHFKNLNFIKNPTIRFPLVVTVAVEPSSIPGSIAKPKLNLPKAATARAAESPGSGGS
jgi:hypothetical protein